MKASNVTSARATAPPRPTGRSSGKRPPSPTGKDFALTGTSQAPDPAVHAYRKDLADIALAGTVIASHYAEPVRRRLNSPEPLRAAPDLQAEVIRELSEGEAFDMLDDSVGWAWGYAGEDRRVGYVRSQAIGDLS